MVSLSIEVGRAVFSWVVLLPEANRNSSWSAYQCFFLTVPSINEAVVLNSAHLIKH